MAYNYTAQIIDAPRSNLDKTVRVFDQFYNFDLVVGATAVYGGSWLEGAGAVFAENQALRWIADLAGLPKSAGGVFAQGGTIGNLSALVVAREYERIANKNVVEWVIACNRNAHSSIKAAAMVMDALVLQVEPGADGVMRGEDLDRAISEYERANPTHKIFAVVATATFSKPAKSTAT